MPDPSRRHRGSTSLLFLAATLVVITLTYRAPILAVSPLLERIIADTGISGTVAGLLTTIPVVCFGVISPLAPALARRFGMEWTFMGIFAVLTGGLLLRSTPSLATLFLGTVIIGAAVAIGNVLLPGFVKREAPNHLGPLTAVYSAAISASGAAGAGLTLPLMEHFGLDWRGGLAMPIIPILLGMFILIPWLLKTRGTSLRSARVHIPTGLWRNRLAWQITIFMGMQSLLFFSVSGWLPTYLIAEGMSDHRAGFMLSISPLLGAAGAFIAPNLTNRRPDQRWLVWISGALCATGIIGLLFLPMTFTPLWVLTFGFGSGMTLSLSLTFMVLRTPDANHAADMSSMAQSVGYTLAALGPLIVGFARDLTGDWTIPMLLILAGIIPLMLSGLAAAQDRLVTDA
jgi:CP family cyanate transporter-like MFS transporter